MTEPALKPEQWASGEKVYFRPPRGSDEGYGVERTANAYESPGTLTVFDDSWAVSILPETRHALAAICLAGQPFGFSRVDVEALRAEVHAVEDDIESLTTAIRVYGDSDARQFELAFERGRADTLRSIVEKIVALLPPEDS